MFATVIYSFLKDTSIKNFSSPDQKNSFIFMNWALKNPGRDTPFSQTIPKAKILKKKAGFPTASAQFRNQKS